MGTLLGERIRRLRETQDISLREFAKLLGNLSPAHISDIELGRRYPSSDLLEKIAVKLHVPLVELEILDYRAPVEQLKRFAEANPTYGFALRRMVDKEVSPEEILEFLDWKEEGTKNGES